MTDHSCSQAKFNKKIELSEGIIELLNMVRVSRSSLTILKGMVKLGRVIWSLLDWIPGLLLHCVARIPGLLLRCVVGMYNRDTYKTDGQNKNIEI